MDNTKRAIFGYLISLALLAALFYYIGLENIFDTLTKFNAVYLLPVIFIFFSVLLLNALILKIIYRPTANLNYFYLLKQYLSSWSLGTVLPSRVGEFSLAYFLRKEVPIGKSTAILVLDKLVSLAVFSFFSVIAMLYFFGFNEAFQLFLILTVLGVLVTFFILSERARNLLKKTIFAKIKHYFTGFSKTLTTYLKNEKKVIFANFLLTLGRLFLQAAFFFFIFLGFGVTVSPLILIYVISIVTILGLLPLAPNGLGIRQVSLVFFMGILGVNVVKTAGVSVISLLITYSFVLLIIIVRASTFNKFGRGKIYDN